MGPRSETEEYRMPVGFFERRPTHMPELLQITPTSDQRRTEHAAMGSRGRSFLPACLRALRFDDLDSLPFPAWHLFHRGRMPVGRSFRKSRHSFPILSS